MDFGVNDADFGAVADEGVFMRSPVDGVACPPVLDDVNEGFMDVIVGVDEVGAEN